MAAGPSLGPTGHPAGPGPGSVLRLPRRRSGADRGDREAAAPALLRRGRRRRSARQRGLIVLLTVRWRHELAFPAKLDRWQRRGRRGFGAIRRRFGRSGIGLEGRGRETGVTSRARGSASGLEEGWAPCPVGPGTGRLLSPNERSSEGPTDFPGTAAGGALLRGQRRGAGLYGRARLGGGPWRAAGSAPGGAGRSRRLDGAPAAQPG